MISLLICEFVLDIYGFCQNAMDFVSMTQKTFTKSTTYKFLILMRFLSLFDYLLKSIVMAWLFFDWSEESCFYLAIGLLFTETSNISSMFGISVLRLITVIKKKKIINLDQLENSLSKYININILVLPLMNSTFRSQSYFPLGLSPHSDL